MTEVANVDTFLHLDAIVLGRVAKHDGYCISYVVTICEPGFVVVW